MSFDPKQAGFTWPAETHLTNPDNVTITVRPYAANFAGLSTAGESRSAECSRYYATNYGLYTELEIKTWLAGGPAECIDLLGTFNATFDARGVQELPFAEIVAGLQARGFASQTIVVNLSWLVQDGYAELNSGTSAPMIRRLRR